MLPYGKVARICGLSDRQMGKRVETLPEGRGRYALYDSAPGSTALRSFYLTGFDDGCARQFSAAVAVLAGAESHEQLRYGLPAEVQPYSTTDKAYEDLKSRVCRVGRGKPCGTRINRMERDTVFVSIYERFGSNAQWNTVLVHDGAVVAQDRKGAERPSHPVLPTSGAGGCRRRRSGRPSSTRVRPRAPAAAERGD